MLNAEFILGDEARSEPHFMAELKDSFESTPLLVGSWTYLSIVLNKTLSSKLTIRCVNRACHGLSQNFLQVISFVWKFGGIRKKEKCGSFSCSQKGLIYFSGNESVPFS